MINKTTPEANNKSTSNQERKREMKDIRIHNFISTAIFHSIINCFNPLSDASAVLAHFIAIRGA
jgi:hypothetical protein